MTFAQTACSRSEDGLTPVLGGSEQTSVCPADVSIVDRTNALIRGLELIVCHHGVNKNLRVELFNQVHDYLDSSPSELVWMKRTKSLLADPLARYLRNEPPAAPDCGRFRPSGQVGRWMKARLLNYNRKNTHLWTSWLQCKKATLDSSEEIVNINYADHCKVLVSKDDGDDDLINSIFEIPAMENHLEYIAKQSTVVFSESRIFTDLQPSTSASYGSKRSEQGAFGELVRSISSYEEDYLYPDDLVSMVLIPRLNGKTHHKVHEIRCVSTLLGQDWEDALSKQYFERKPCTLSAKIQGIVEPMKVRVISKGPALEYYAAKPLQEAWHGVMREMSCYRLIGRPLCPTDVIDLHQNVPSSWEWFSVDYKAATDNLSWKYSGRILKHLTKYLSPRLQELAWDVLGPHQLVYPNGAHIQSQKMERGQLMGSVLSFIILCIANYGLYLSVTNDIQKGWTDQERMDHCLINGDDQLYCAPVELWNVHIDKGQRVGLEMSVGKAYHHSRYSNLNSTSIDCPIGSPQPYQVTYLNSGLFFGVSKVRSQTDTDKPEKDIVELLPKVLAGSLPGRQCGLLGAWFQTHSAESIRRCCEISIGRRKTIVRSMFMPKSLGGMGVDAPLGWRHYRSHHHMVYASTFVIKRPEHEHSFPLPFPGLLPKKLNEFVEKPYYKAPVVIFPKQSVCGHSYIKTLREANYPLIPIARFRDCYVT
jgi:hypothetical protein